MTILRAPTVRTTVARIAATEGPRSEHYAVPLDLPFLYKFVVGSSDTADSFNVIAHQGGTAGRWKRARLPVKGADLGDASVTVTIDGKLLRYIPAATLTTNRTLTLGTTGAENGDVITIVRLDTTASTVAVVNGGAGAGTLATMPVSVRSRVSAYFDGTNWLLLEAVQFFS